MSLAKPELSHSLRHSCFLRAQKGSCPAEPWPDTTRAPRTQQGKPGQAPSEKAQTELGKCSEALWTPQSSLITQVPAAAGCCY